MPISWVHKRPFPFPWYLPLAAAYPALTLYASNVKETNFGSVVVAVFSLVMTSMVLWFVAGYIVRNRERAALPVALAVLFFWLYKYGQLLAGLSHTIYLPLHLAVALSVVGITWWVDCRRRQIRVIASVAMTTLVTTAVLQAVVRNIVSAATEKPRAAVVSRSGSTGRDLSLVRPQNLPDIYCIILDSYGSTSVLSERFGYDNSEFVAELSNRGFNIPVLNASNYSATKNAVPALLRMGYRDEDGSVPRYLIDKGYEFWYSRSVYPLDKSAVSADKILGKDYGTEFWHQLILQSMLGPSWKTFGRTYRDAIHSNFRHLSAAAANTAERPLFMFAHIMVPHSPFVFKADGSARYLLYTGLRKDIEILKAAYRDQCAFANVQILKSIDAITSTDRGRNAVIILLGDHGPFYQLFSPQAEEAVDAEWEVAMYQNLLAIKLPGSRREKVPEMTNVNVFRWVFHHIFDELYSPLPDRFFRDYLRGTPEEATDVISTKLGFRKSK